MSTILLVEDDPAVSQVIEEHLIDAGFSVVSVTGTTAALQRMNVLPTVDLLLVDLVMPEDQPDGLAFATTVTARAADLPIIFITGYYGFVARVGTLPGTVLYKPIDLELLTGEIRARLGAGPA